MRVEAVAVVRSYRIVSSSGTGGTYFQQLLTYTTARRKVPAARLAPLLARYPLTPPVEIVPVVS